MGVHGITKFLKEQNILPSDSTECCSTSLWKEWNPSMEFLQHSGPTLTRLPPKSKLLIDGNGLAFHLAQIAYARYLQDRFSTPGVKSCRIIKSMSDTEISEALPTMLPPDFVRQVTREFVTTLAKLDLDIQCYWDGREQGTFKLSEHSRRTRDLDGKWGALETFCRHGMVPMKQSEPVCQCFYVFPQSPNMFHAVKHALRSCGVVMVQCRGEADAELARTAKGDPRAFVLGQDSDFLLFKDIQYIPLGGIHLSSSSSKNARLHVVCLTRRKIAESLGLDDEDMVELAILLGNDYVDNRTLKIPDHVKTVQDRIVYLQQNADDGFRVKSKNDEAPELDYVRGLYNMNDQLALYYESNLEDSDDEMKEDDSFSSEKVILSILSSAEVFGLEFSQADFSNSSIRDVILRRLQTFAGLSSDCERQRAFAVGHKHVDAYQEATATPTTIFSVGLTKRITLSKRPNWNDICVAFLADECIAQALRITSESNMLASQASPDSMMNHLRFHQLLAASSESDCEESDASVVEDPPPLPRPVTNSVERPVLPIDEHEEKIMANIQQNRVTIIHGETGCGKSSRVPVMILDHPSPEPSLPRVEIFVSQPRRIAAASLVERVRSSEPDHGDKFALRLGHGVREYESGKTQAWFVTTGYLTRLLANHPERFNRVTHLIIDEVHERSVDTDLLCLLCRRLLDSNKRIRLVLMSATMASKLYKEYFNVSNDPIHVGVRRFPITEFFVEDLHRLGLPPVDVASARDIQQECEKKRCRSAPSPAEMIKRYHLTTRLVTIVGLPGTSVLIFVPGMAEIVAVTELIEALYRPGITYVCYPIHSDIPFDEQMGAFNAPGLNEVKVIIATNAAESSVTLPAVDHVICFGLCRQVMYNEQSHRQILAPCWISRASATQRAGRTGRLRPGSVYRLYTRTAYEGFMDEFEQGEMMRIPLDSVILMIKEILHDEAIPALQSCIEPPRLETIEKSFESLYQWSFLSEPNDSSQITSLGCFVSALGIDLTLGFFIGLGIQFGVAAEAVEMAAIMSFPKSPFQISNPLFHSVPEYNEITSQTYISRCHFDANLYSEPLALMNALWDYHIAPDKHKWCTFYRISLARMRQLFSTTESLRKRVALFLGINESRLRAVAPPVHMPHSKITILRILKVWVFSDTILQAKPVKLNYSGDGAITFAIPQRNSTVTDAMLRQVLTKDRHPYQILSRQLISCRGRFLTDQSFSLADSVEATIQRRLVSYMCEASIDVAILSGSECTYTYFRNDLVGNRCISGLSEKGHNPMSLIRADYDPQTKRRGMLERKCGLWKVTPTSEMPPATRTEEAHQIVRLFGRVEGGQEEDLCRVASDGIANGEIMSLMIFQFFTRKRKPKKFTKEASVDQDFMYTLKGQCQAISEVDLKDLLATQSVLMFDSTSKCSQSVCFPKSVSQPKVFRGKGSESMATSCQLDSCSWTRPLLADIPEGARTLSVLVSGQRKSYGLKFEVGNEENDSLIEITFPHELNTRQRWTRMGMSGNVYVPTETVPASAIVSEFPVLAVCSNTLEIRGGGLKVEGMTILPPNPMFLLLCRLSFGLGPNIDKNFNSMATLTSATEDDGTTLSVRAENWLKARLDDLKHDASKPNALPFVDESIHEHREKITDALAFHKSCANMGESLFCFPDRTRALVELFNGVEEYPIDVDDMIEERGLTPENLTKWRLEAKCVVDEGERPKLVKNAVAKVTQTKRETSDGKSTSNTTVPTQSRHTTEPTTEGIPTGTGESKLSKVASSTQTKAKAASKTASKTIDATEGKLFPNTLPTQTKMAESKKGGNGIGSESGELLTHDETSRLPIPIASAWEPVHKFDAPTKEMTVRLFLTDLGDRAHIKPTSLPSTNILSLVVQQYVSDITAIYSHSPLKAKHNYVDPVPKNWRILMHQDVDAKLWYVATYKNLALPYLKLSGRGKGQLPKWMKTYYRPKCPEDAEACVPHTVPVPEARVVHFSKKHVGLAYESIEAALQMEAAFFLERQFATASKACIRHWFEYTLDEMIHKVIKSARPTAK